MLPWWPGMRPNGIELSLLASPRILSNAKPDSGLARSAPARCQAAATLPIAPLHRRDAAGDQLLEH
jgi:hypothetical protein